MVRDPQHPRHGTQPCWQLLHLDTVGNGGLSASAGIEDEGRVVLRTAIDEYQNVTVVQPCRVLLLHTEDAAD